MRKSDETKPIRALLETYESQAPDFDSLFESEVLGDAPFRQICQSKLNNFEADAPSFDRMFAGSPLVKTIAPKRMLPLWTAIGAVAACLALILLLPQRMQMEKESLSQIESTTVKKSSTHKARKHQAIIPQKEILAQTLKLESPKSIKTLSIDHKVLKVRETLAYNQEKPTDRDSTSKSLTKINPSAKSNLDVTYERSVEEAYAAARIKKTKAKREKLNLGTNFSSSNRLLSLVNTKSANTYPLQSASNNITDGYYSLEGASTPMLRTVTVSRNAWETPENISNEALKKYEATYSLPINLGISISVPLFRYLEITTGLNYTYMSAKISGKDANQPFELKQELHYVGIPLKLSVTFLKIGHFGTYVAAGGTIEKGLTGIQKSSVINSNGETDEWSSKQSIYGFQPSVSGQLGIYYDLNKSFNVYLEPGASYFFPNDQPISSRTEEPFNFNLGLGLRYRIN